MKKIMMIILLLIIIYPLYVKADHVYNVDVKINIKEDGSANIVEKWDINSYGNGWCKKIKYLDGIYVYYNSMHKNNKRLNYRDYGWASFLYGKNEYGGHFEYKNKRLNLCFNDSSFKKNTYILDYTINEYIYNIDSGQVLYWNLLNNISADNINIEISSYFDFNDNIDLSLYGYDGNVYIDNGKIYIDSVKKLKDDYVVLLARFPVSSFNTVSKINNYNNIDDYKNHAEMGLYEDSNEIKNIFRNIIYFVVILIILRIFIGFIIKKINKKLKYSYGYINNKVIDMDNVLMFRDIPIGGDIFYAYVLFRLNRIDCKNINIVSAIVLKWIYQKKISVRKIDNVRVLDLVRNSKFENEYEDKLFNMMYDASNNGVLETKEFNEWVKHYDMKFLALFAKMEDELINRLKKDMHIYHRINKNECRYRYVMDDKIYNDSVQLYGFKKYLEEFSRMDMKEIMELHLWEEYLIFAALFGMTDKINIQLRELYSDIEEIDKYDLI